MNKIYVRISIVALLVPGSVFPYFPLNIFQPSDINTYDRVRPQDSTMAIGATGEFGFNAKGWTAEDLPCDPPKKGCRVNVLQLWQPEQNALAMLKGFPPATEIGSLAQQLNVDDDNGVRGHLCFCGDLKVQANVLFSARWFLPYNFILGGYVPFTSLALENVHFHDKTKDIMPEDLLTKELITNDLVHTVKRLSNGFVIGNWKQMGIGDAAIVLDWSHDFPQAKPLLKNVRTNIRVGCSLPTGKKQNPDELFSIPLGNEGALGFIFGAGLDLQLASVIKTGVDIEFLQLFSALQERRIKVDGAQTDHLLLAKTCVIKDFGLTHRFNLYLECFDLIPGLFGRLTYQFFKHEDDRLAVMSNAYSSVIANSARSLEEWTMHNLIYKVGYRLEDDQWCSPSFALFYKQPINGKNAVLAHTVGLVASISF